MESCLLLERIGIACKGYQHTLHEATEKISREVKGADASQIIERASWQHSQLVVTQIKVRNPVHVLQSLVATMVSGKSDGNHRHRDWERAGWRCFGT